ncbi:hypothetical protein VIGAN_01057900 [Vigna angularis var. angularis]|uniref:Uncharacterized protein n=1 Tax=Vigna angularis var. angularis TaxID=157739 RepID=A0A0S3QXP6_PHAAN|nr:hypothetical protein VIGAN_01057900 [Vigna angularis var. angularis]
MGLWTRVEVSNRDILPDTGLKWIVGGGGGEDAKRKHVVWRKKKIKGIRSLFSRQVYPFLSVNFVKAV